MEWTCKHCLNNFQFENNSQKANHSRWCQLNPKSSEYREALAHSRSFIDDSSLEKMKSSIKVLWEQGNYINADHGKGFRGKTHKPESKLLIKHKALASKHRRLVRKPILYKDVLLDGSWELALAQRLDFLQINWIRPEPIKWIDQEGLEHNYFPDFYLVDYNLYLDPKNPQAFKIQQNKIEILNKTYDNIIWLRSLYECQTFGSIVKRI